MTPPDPMFRSLTSTGVPGRFGSGLDPEAPTWGDDIRHCGRGED